MNPLTAAHIRGEGILRDQTVAGVTRAWVDLSAYNRSDIPTLVNKVVPFVEASKRSSATLTNAYLARILRRRPLAISYRDIVGDATRRGTLPDEVYSRAFLGMWAALGRGERYEQAVEVGKSRVARAAAMDVQLAMRATLAVTMSGYGIVAYHRVANGGACEFCSSIDGERVSAEGFQVHNYCGCGAEPDTSGEPVQMDTPEHGELGSIFAGEEG